MSDSATNPPVASSAADAVGTAPGGTSSVAVDRREERLSARTVARPVERVRLEKYIVSEERTLTVTVQHEEFRLVRGLEPFPAAERAGADTTASVGAIEDASFVLHEERLIITREVVPVERVQLRSTVVTENQTVTAALRSERVEVSER